MTEFCKNHPDREAKRKCYHCKSPICTDCQITIAHHIYCSKKCYFNYLISQVLERLERYYHFCKRKLTRFYAALKKEPAFLVVFLILFISLIVSIVLTTISIHKVNRLDQMIQELHQSIALPDTSYSVEDIAKKLDTLSIFSPPANAMVIKNEIDIEGEAEENHVVTLSGDGEILSATLVRGGKFIFKDIKIKPGTNHFVVRSINEQGTSIILEEISFKYNPPTPSFLARDFTRGSIEEKKIALTFDGDYLDNVTEEILDVLKQENVRCTMFLTGRYIRRYSEHIKRMLAEGHEIGNHTWTHPHLTTFEQDRKHQTRPGVTRELVQQELMKTAELFYRITGQKMKPYWRAPFGEHNAEIRQWAAEIGYRQIGWTVGKDWQNGMDTLDWVADTSASYYHTADEIAEKVLSFGKDSPYGANGTIILMHLGTLRKGDYPHEKLPQIIREMKRLGYQFVTISELIM